MSLIYTHKLLSTQKCVVNVYHGHHFTASGVKAYLEAVKKSEVQRHGRTLIILHIIWSYF